MPGRSQQSPSTRDRQTQTTRTRRTETVQSAEAEPASSGRSPANRRRNTQSTGDRQGQIASSAHPRGSGRPLDEGVDAAILDAAWRLLLAEGYSRMSIARVADSARVGRPAIYRRYRDKSDLVAAVIADKSARVPPVDTGDTRQDLIEHLEFARRRFTIRLAGTLLVEEAEHPELLEQFREGMLLPRREAIALSLERGKERGEVRPDLDTRLAAHAVMGSFVFHYLTVGRPQKGWSEQVVDTLWPGFAVPARDRKRSRA
jgi:AcrR family transcriptional regulator